MGTFRSLLSVPISSPAKSDSTYPAVYCHSYVRNASICAMEATEYGEIPFASNFVTLHTADDQLDDSTQLFKRGEAYTSGSMTAGLKALFELTGIGNGSKPVHPDPPRMTDPAWKSYRLTGTQTDFYNRDGYPTILGASMTEGGFVNTPSCLSCQVQASVNAEGENAVPGAGATGRLNLLGLDTVNGAPSVDSYYARGTTKQRAVPVDFVWGVLLAR